MKRQGCGMEPLVRLVSCLYFCFDFECWYFKVARNEADLGVIGFGCGHTMTAVVGCTHATQLWEYRWISRAPQEVFPYTNLLRIFTPHCWLAILCSMICVAIFFLVAANVGTLYGAVSNYSDVVMFPFRYGTIFICLHASEHCDL